MDFKKLLLAVLLLVGASAGVYFWKNHRGLTHKTLRICTWSNYFLEDQLRKFSDEEGVRVELSYISSNEELFAKLKAGASGYDIIQPSDYMVKKMARLGMISPIQHAELPNIVYIEDFYRQLPYDPGLKFSVPFTWGSTGIAVDTSRLKLSEGGVSWKLLLESPDPRHTSILDDMREVFSVVMKAKGLSSNLTDPFVLEGVAKELGMLKKTILTFSSEPKALLLRGEVSIAHIFSSDGVQASAENPAIQYFIPKEGATIWTDNFAVPVTSTQKKEAHAFINYFLKPENAMALFENNLLATPNRVVRERLPAALRENRAIYPEPSVMKRLEFLDDLGDTLEVMNRYWTELKS